MNSLVMLPIKKGVSGVAIGSFSLFEIPAAPDLLNLSSLVDTVKRALITSLSFSTVLIMNSSNLSSKELILSN
ncbi:MAG: hypothetical protein ACTSP3_13815 [Candidatus Heimdallarchaeaceae archaeon]